MHSQKTQFIRCDFFFVTWTGTSKSFRTGVKLVALKVLGNFALRKCRWKFSRLIIQTFKIRNSESCVDFTVVSARWPFIHVQQAHVVTCKEIYSLLVVYFHFRSNYQTYTVLKLNYFYSLSRHAYEINPWLYHKLATHAAMGNNVKGRFPTLKANLYLISCHLSFLFLSFSSDYRSLCLLLAGKRHDLTKVQVSSSQLSARWLERFLA